MKNCFFWKQEESSRKALKRMVPIQKRRERRQKSEHLYLDTWFQWPNAQAASLWGCGVQKQLNQCNNIFCFYFSGIILLRFLCSFMKHSYFSIVAPVYLAKSFLGFCNIPENIPMNFSAQYKNLRKLTAKCWLWKGVIIFLEYFRGLSKIWTVGVKLS